MKPLKGEGFLVQSSFRASLTARTPSLPFSAFLYVIPQLHPVFQLSHLGAISVALFVRRSNSAIFPDRRQNFLRACL